MSNNRVPMGRPAITHNSSAVVAADAVSLLSGVNFGSVEKVLAALQLIHEFSGTDLQALVKLADIPLERVNPAEPQYRARARATRALCEDIAVSRVSDKYAQVLHLDGRFLGVADV